jgi:hypothetical protein
MNSGNTKIGELHIVLKVMIQMWEDDESEKSHRPFKQSRHRIGDLRHSPVLTESDKLFYALLKTISTAMSQSPLYRESTAKVDSDSFQVSVLAPF